MGLYTNNLRTMDDLFVHLLRDIYYAENRIVKALVDMIETASDPRLKKAFKSHLHETENHILRLQQVFRMRGVDVKGVDCPAIDGILEEADDVTSDVEGSIMLNAALIAAAQTVEHYEIARYGSLIAWAKMLGRDDCASLLQKNLEEDQAADRRLAVMAENGADRAVATA